MSDSFHDRTSSLQSPATRLASVAPDDTTDLGFATRAIAVGAEGFVQVTTIAGDTGRVFIVPGAAFPIRVRRIWAAGTTAADIVALA